MSRRAPRIKAYREHAAGIATEIALAVAIFWGGLLVIFVLELLVD